MKEVQIAQKGDKVMSTYSHHGKVLIVRVSWKNCIDTKCGARIKHGNYRIIGGSHDTERVGSISQI